MLSSSLSLAATQKLLLFLDNNEKNLGKKQIKQLKTNTLEVGMKNKELKHQISFNH